MEVAGYIFRILAAKKNLYSVAYFVGQYFCIVVAPVFYSAAIFTLLSSMLEHLQQHKGIDKLTPLSRKAILWLFITCDAIATLIQITGASLVGSVYSNGKDPNVPNKILLAGLIFQVAAFAVFLWCYLTFLWRVHRLLSPKLKFFAAVTLLASLAVYLRTIIRLAETAEGLLRFLSTHEASFAALEFAPNLMMVYLFVVFYPGRYLHDRITVTEGVSVSMSDMNERCSTEVRIRGCRV